MNAFLDTNVPIAYVFQFNSHHVKSKEIVKVYSQLFWSNFVKKEFEKRFSEKHEDLSLFFNDLDKYLENPLQEFYSISDLVDFARQNYDVDMRNDSISSINQFWDMYFKFQTQIPFFKMKNAIEDSLNDLSLNLNSNKLHFQSIMQLTPQRTKDYPQIEKMLKLEGVHENDRTVILDGHDFACNIKSPVDFVSFDDDCFKGASNVKSLCFHSVKGRDDFNAS